MAYCKCKWCSKPSNTNIAYKAVIKDKNIYFCNQEHCNLYFKEKQKIDKELKELDDVYQYVKTNLFKYNDSQKLPKSFITRLQDLRNGTVVQRGVGRVVRSKEGYPYVVILDTFKKMSETILWCFQNKPLNTEGKKISYMMAIVENNINDVYRQYKVNKIQKIETQSSSIEMINTVTIKVAEEKEEMSLLDFLDEDELL